MTLNSSNLFFDLSSSSADKLVVGAGPASVSGANTINIGSVGSSLSPGNFTLISAPAGGLNGGTYQFATGLATIIPAGTNFYKLTLSGSSTSQSVVVSNAANFIIKDAFTGTSGNTISGQAPSPTNLPGGTYTLFGATTAGTVKYNGSGATIGVSVDKGAGVTISTSGGYIKPTAMTISAGLTMGTVNAGTLSSTSYFGLGLGYYPSLPGSATSVTNFNGIVLEPTGALALVSTSGTTESVLASVAWPTATLGAFSTSTSYTVSYAINTSAAAGGVSNVAVSNGAVTDFADFASIDGYVGTNNFTNANTAFAAFMQVASTSQTTGGVVSNFALVSANQVQLPFWTGTNSTTWSDGGNWSSGTAPGATSGTTNTDVAAFNANPVNSTPVVDAGRNLMSITFTSSSVGALTLGTPAGNALLLTSGGTIQTASSVTNPEAVNAPLVLEGNFGTYTFTSGATLSTATLNFGGGITAGGTTGITTLTLNGSNTGANALSGAIANGSNGATLALTMQAGNWVIAGPGSYTGATTVGGGTLTVGNGATGSLGSTTISVGGGALVVAAGGSLASSPINITSGSMSVLSGGMVAAPTISISGGSLTVNAGAIVGNAAILTSGSGAFNVLPGSGTASIGLTGPGSGGATLSVGSGTTFSMVDGQAGTFNLRQQSSFSGPALTLNNSTLNFDLSSAGADSLAVSQGSVSLSGTNSIGITPLGSSLTVGGTYPLTESRRRRTEQRRKLQVPPVQALMTRYVTVGSNAYLLSLHNASTAETVSVAAAPTLTVTTNLYAWYDATSGIAVNGSNVVQSWTDKSGNGHNMTISSGSPTYVPTGFNGLPAVLLSGQNTNGSGGDVLTSNNFTNGLTGAPNLTIFAVFTDTTASGTESHPILFGGHAGLQAVMIGKQGGVAGMATGFGQNVQSTYNVATNGFSDIVESFRYAGGALNAATTSVKVNGAEYFTATGTDPGTLNLQSGNAAYIGNSSAIQAGGINGDIAEILVYNGYLSTADENSVGYYLSQKWGLNTSYTAPTAWTGTTSTVWSDTTNWTGGVPGATGGSTTSNGAATFNTFNPTNTAPVVDAGRNLESITFDNGTGNLTSSITLGTTTGNALLLTSGGTIQTTSSVVNAQNINAPLVLEGVGGNYSFTSAATSTAGTLNFGGGIHRQLPLTGDDP